MFIYLKNQESNENILIDINEVVFIQYKKPLDNDSLNNITIVFKNTITAKALILDSELARFLSYLDDKESIIGSL